MQQRQISFKLIMYQDVVLPDFTDTVMNNSNSKTAKVCRGKKARKKKLMRQQAQNPLGGALKCSWEV